MNNLLLFFEETSTDTGNSGGMNWTMIILLVLMVGLFVWTTISSNKQRKKQQKEEEAKRDRLRVGSMIMTQGGVRGKVVELNDKEFVIETGTEENKSYLRYIKAALWTIEDEKTDKAEEVETNEIK